MGQSFKLVQRYSKPGDKTSEKKWYASAKHNGVANIDEICDLIAARSTVSSADVKAVLDNLNYVIDYQLKSGRLVHMGELGNFRITIKSKGSNEKSDFSQSYLKGAKIVFTPGAALRETRITTKFTQVSEKEQNNTGDNTDPTDPSDTGEI